MRACACYFPFQCFRAAQEYSSPAAYRLLRNFLFCCRNQPTQTACIKSVTIIKASISGYTFQTTALFWINNANKVLDTTYKCAN